MVAAEAVYICPDEMVLVLEDFPAQALPETDDFDVWHEENGSRDGVITELSGLQYSVAQEPVEGGISAEPGEEIFAYYHGFFPNGEVFDSSYLRGRPLVGPSNRFIRGWNEALEDMKVCEARTLYIPADLAYGNSGAGGRPTGTLLFHMQLLRVNEG